MAGIINGILGGLGNAACSLLNSCESSSSTDSEPASTSAAAASTKAADSVADNTRVVATFVTVAPFTASTSPARATSSAIAAAVASSASPSLSVRSQTTQTSPIATAATTATTSPSALTTSTPEAIASTFVTSRVILASQSASQTATVATESSDGSSSSTDSTSSSVSSSSVSTSSAADSTPRGAIDADLVLLGLFAFLLLAALVVSRRRVQQSKARALALQRTPSVEPYRLSDLKEDDQYSSDSECDMSIRASTAMGYAKLDLASLPRAQRVSTLPYLSSQSSQRSSTVDPLVVRQRLYEALPEPPISQADHQLGTALTFDSARWPFRQTPGLAREAHLPHSASSSAYSRSDTHRHRSASTATRKTTTTLSSMGTRLSFPAPLTSPPSLPLPPSPSLLKETWLQELRREATVRIARVSEDLLR